MVAGDVPLICYVGGELFDEDSNASYIGGCTRGGKIPIGISFTSFRKKIQEMIKLSSHEMDFKIKCGVSFDEDTLIALDVDDDKSLQFIMDNCNFIRAYVLKQVPATRTFSASQREKVALPFGADNHLHDPQGINVYNDFNMWKELELNIIREPMHPLLNVDSHPEDLFLSTSNSKDINEDALICHGDPVMDKTFFKEVTMDKLMTRGHRGGNFDDYKGDEIETSWRDKLLCSPDINNAVALPDINTELQISSSSIIYASPDSAVPDSGGIDLHLWKEFEDIDAFRNALSDLAVRTGYEYKSVRTSPTKLKMKCASEGCHWYIQANRFTDLSSFKVTKYQEVHTCMIRTSSGYKDHSQATIRWIVSKIQSSIEKDPDIEPSKIVKLIKNQFGIEISYNKAVKSKTKSLERINRPLLESYALLPKLIKELEWEENVVKLEHLGGSFQYLFWAFSACIHALRAPLRPILFVYSKMVKTGFLMYACGVDGNGFCGQVIHVAFAVFAAEDDSAWELFLSCLKEFIISENFHSHPLTIVTDFKKSAVSAVENVLPDVHHFYFTETFKDTFLRKFRGCGLAEHWVAASEASSSSDCEEALQNIKCIDESAYDWLVSIGLGHWTYAFSNVHCRACPSRNDEFTKELIELPIVNIVKKTRDMIADYFSIRRSSEISNLTSSVVLDLESAKAELSSVKVELIPQNHYQVVGPNYSYVVDLGKRSCSCGEFQATGCPCSHAIMTVLHLDLDVATYYSPWFTAETYRATYSKNLPVISDISKWKPRDNEVHLLPSKRRKVGRPRKFQYIK